MEKTKGKKGYKQRNSCQIGRPGILPGTLRIDTLDTQGRLLKFRGDCLLFWGALHMRVLVEEVELFELNSIIFLCSTALNS